MNFMLPPPPPKPGARADDTLKRAGEEAAWKSVAIISYLSDNKELLPLERMHYSNSGIERR